MNRKRANRQIAELENYQQCIPLGTIASILEDNGFVMLQEDDTKWDGFLSGEEGRVAFNLGNADKPIQEHMPGFSYTRYKPINSCLVLSWLKMPRTGNYDVCAYIS